MTWAMLTDEQRESVRATMRAAIEAAREEGYDDDERAHEAALAELDTAGVVVEGVQTLVRRAEKAEADRADALRALAALSERTGNLLAATSGAGDFGDTWTTTNAALREARAVIARLTAPGSVQ